MTRENELKANEIVKMTRELSEKEEKIRQLQEGRPVMAIPPIRYLPREASAEPVDRGARRFYSAPFHNESSDADINAVDDPLASVFGNSANDGQVSDPEIIGCGKEVVAEEKKHEQSKSARVRVARGGTKRKAASANPGQPRKTRVISMPNDFFL